MSGLVQTKCPWAPEPLVHDAFGDALKVEMRHPFKEKGVFEDYGAAGAGSERVLVIAYGTSGVRCHRLAYFVSHAIVQDLRVRVVLRDGNRTRSRKENQTGKRSRTK